MSDLKLVDFQGQEALRLRAPDGSTAIVLLHGGHLVSWVPLGQGEQLYLSPTARYGAGASVRGGMPVIFPQFNERGPLPRHGLVRTRAWTPVESVVRGGHALGVLRFDSTEETLAIWPQPFSLELTFSVVANTLEIELAVTNTGDTPLDFTAALHTYLRCNDVLKAQLEGLQTCHYEDCLKGEFHQQWGDVVSVIGPIDRIYRHQGQPLVLRELGRRVDLQLSGFEDVVVWNPGAEGAAALSDMPDADWTQMLCVEAACVREPVTVMPGDEWVGMQTLSC
ncbi:D-hexose-6-phosphate mutarotase [Ideonella sp.]|jgi:glucose-6-phosphate 1-epimerase|uniref:D-hexose-6-phosphate mutarotase n=1 Tax=Ideonella sp. TaxID=1929293 RepID=UPI0037C181E8